MKYISHLTLMGLFLILYLFFTPAGAQGLPADISSGLICSDNDYALCSHANCQCLDEDGKPGDCDIYQGTDTGWAQCTCPVVKTGNTGKNIAYNANFATLDCEELAEPSASGTAFPSYVEKTEPKVYSTYSFGDSLNNNLYGTKDNASLMVCDQPNMMTLCLDMPCTINENGDASCYCQNVVVDTTDPGNACSGGSWNTLGGDCSLSSCDPGKNRVWSAACLDQTLSGIAALTVSIRYDLDQKIVDMPEYCPDQ